MQHVGNFIVDIVSLCMGHTVRRQYVITYFMYEICISLPELILYENSQFLVLKVVSNL